MTPLFFLLLSASDLPSEGVFVNLREKHALLCVRDRRGCLVTEAAEPGGRCVGDAVFLSDNTVFKIPNHTVFLCDEMSCAPDGLRSSIVFLLAKKKNGAEKYDRMSYSTFRALIRGAFCDPDENRTEEKRETGGEK